METNMLPNTAMFKPLDFINYERLSDIALNLLKNIKDLEPYFRNTDPVPVLGGQTVTVSDPPDPDPEHLF
jgi:hypothetical protein